MKNRYAAIAIGLCITGTAMAQLAPIAAKVHDGVESIVGGKVVVEHVRDGVLYRAPDGSTVTRYQDEKGTDWILPLELRTQVRCRRHRRKP
jgi:hypothetical protein